MRTVEVDGYRFIKDEISGYWQSNQFIKTDGKPKRLHRYIWEKYNGPIPKGYEIHHVDENKDNNDISNLMCLSNHDHQSHHGKERTVNNPKWLKKFHDAGVAAAPEWHASKAGHEWHKRHYETMKDSLHKTFDFKCQQCGKSFVGHYNSKFCSNNCKSKWRRDNHLDDVDRQCVICGKSFRTNKYGKRKTCSGKCSFILRNRNQKAKKVI